MYNIRKGWPSNAAIDEVFRAKEEDKEKIKDGMIVAIDKESGNITPATCTTAASDPLCAFVIGTEKVRGTWTGIMSQCVIEVDKDHYETGEYKIGDAVTAKDGKFNKSEAGAEKILGHVLKYDATSGLMRVLWHEAS